MAVPKTDEQAVFQLAVIELEAQDAVVCSAYRYEGLLLFMYGSLYDISS